MALPSSGKATVVVFLDTDLDDAAWQRNAYEHFLSHDSEDDASYDRDPSGWAMYAFAFSRTPLAKAARLGQARPVLVLMDFGPDCLVCRITSVSHRGFLDMQISAWQEAGLDKPSTIRLSRLVTVEKSILKVRIGRLSDEDVGRVQNLWNEKFRL